MKTPPVNMTEYLLVKVAGREPVAIRHREWELLNYLLEHRADAVGAWEIYRDVYGYTPAVIGMTSDTAIHTAVSRIRSALPDVLIAKLRGIGWVLV